MHLAATEDVGREQALLGRQVADRDGPREGGAEPAPDPFARAYARAEARSVAQQQRVRIDPPLCRG
jgi:hypothetical protein